MDVAMPMQPLGGFGSGRFTLRAASECTHHRPVGSRLKMTSVPLGPVVSLAS